MNTYTKDQLFVIRERGDASEITTTLLASYEVSLGPYVGNRVDPELSALEVYEIWREFVAPKYPNGLIPISWYVLPGLRKLEFMPFEHGQKGQENFQTFYHEPQAPGGDFDWFRLYVDDQSWGGEDASSGGYLQSATGWKPQLLTPFVSLEVLDAMAQRMRRMVS